MSDLAFSFQLYGPHGEISKIFHFFFLFFLIFVAGRQNYCHFIWLKYEIPSFIMSYKVSVSIGRNPLQKKELKNEGILKFHIFGSYKKKFKLVYILDLASSFRMWLLFVTILVSWFWAFLFFIFLFHFGLLTLVCRRIFFQSFSWSFQTNYLVFS